MLPKMQRSVAKGKGGTGGKGQGLPNRDSVSMKKLKQLLDHLPPDQ